VILPSNPTSHSVVCCENDLDKSISLNPAMPEQKRPARRGAFFSMITQFV
jgi:hypothetical protein